MKQTSHTWALVLAAGDGRRLSALTTDTAGRAVPKQYCTLGGGPTLLQSAMARGQAVAEAGRVSVVVAAEHRRWWWRALQHLPARNVVVQPRNCGTANGMLLQLLHIEQADPEAEIVMLPSDHLVSDETVLANAMSRALLRIRAAPQEVVLLGMAPEAPDPELGYIVPGPPDQQGICKVLTFVEKPALATAARLIEHGALLNAFIMVARCRTLLELFARARPDILSLMRQAMDFHNDRKAALAKLYAQLPILDFSRQILGKATDSALRVEPVADCGWSDLGTPERIGRAISRMTRAGRVPARQFVNVERGIDLAARYQQLRPETLPEQRATA